MNSWRQVNGAMMARSLVSAVVLALLVAVLKADVQANTLLRRAEAYGIAKEYGRAVDVYEQLAGLHPQWGVPHLRVGQVYLTQGRWEEAERELSRAFELDPGEAEALVALGIVAQERQDLQGALDQWQLAGALNPRNIEVRYRLGRLYLARSEFELAKQEFERVVLYDRGHQGGHYYLGLLLAAEDSSAAREHLRLAAAGEDAQASRGAQEMLALLHNVTASQDQVSMWARLGRAYLEQDVPSLAAAQLGRILLLEPDNNAAQSYLGYALFQMGEHERARELLREVTRAAPKYPLGHYFLAMLHRSQGYLPTALYEFMRALRLDPSNAAVYADVAETYRLMGRYLVAGEWYRAAVKLEPGNEDFRLLLAQFYVDVLPRAEEGVTTAREAVALAPDDPRAHELLGWAHYLAGEMIAARVALERALELDPDFARAYYHLAVVASQRGDEERARWAYERAIDLDSEGLYRARAMAELGE